MVETRMIVIQFVYYA